MSVITEIYYRAVTGDETTAASAVEENLTEAQRMIEEHLGRRLTFGTHVERLKLWPNRLAYPSAVPVFSVPASASYRIYDEATIMNGAPDETILMEWPDIGATEPYPEARGSGYEARYWYTTITYDGGFTIDTMPVAIKRGIAALAKAFNPAFASSVKPAGATSVRVGDVGVTYDKNAQESELDAYVPGLSKRLRGYHLGRLG